MFAPTLQTTSPLESGDTYRADPLAGLNPAQREAVLHGLLAPDLRALLVIAGAGSGKTSTLAHRVGQLIKHGVDPQRILLLTFSRRASLEMQQRVGGVLAAATGSRASSELRLPWAGTFHSIGARLLRDCAHLIGLPETFTVHDRADAEDLIGWVRHDLGHSASKSRFPLKGTCLSIYSRVVNSREPLADVLRQHFPWCEAWADELKKMFAAYARSKHDQHILDYDDLLLYWREVMQDAALASDIGARFDHVLVDEYQDTNALQAEILLALKPTGCGLTVVGDDAQSIYAFRAATVRNILDFPSKFGRPARIVTLERNYRSTQPILDASNAVIAQAKERYAKALWTDKRSSDQPKLVTVSDEAGQARWIADRVLEAREAGVALTSQAALFRTSHHGAALELELTRRNIPFVKFGGLKFLEAAHVKDLVAMLRFAQHPQNRLAGFRILQRVAGIGPAKAGRLMDGLAQASDARTVLRDFNPGASAEQDWAAFRQAYERLREPGLAWPTDLDIAFGWYGDQLDRLFDDARVRRADLDQLLRLAPGYASREHFLTELTLDPPDATSAESGVPLLDEDYMILSTIHSAKGQEWRSVYVLNVVDGCLPSDMSTGSEADIEEERRLLYVAMTRARQSLHVIVPQRFYVTQQTAMGDRHVYGTRSRFIDDAMLPLFEHLPKPPPLGSLPARIEAKPASLDIAKRIGAIWQ
ncbi:MAG: ATP-dependent helicase [Burkholderiaceae bacterium]|nr:ATP-dependent helicase [Burkholderiaceae bacterium]